ncbi:MAG: alanine racemase [Bacteroidetes bacterium]|nr:alanine racemase [Bacteroidota bacterium]
MKPIDVNTLPTPALLVDLDTMERNLRTMASFFENKSCKLRPHFKNHKCIALAKKQLEFGAIGITSATLYETEVLVQAGINSILVANEIAGEANLKKLIELSAEKEIILAVDNEKIVDDIARLSSNRKNNLSLVVDIDLGLKRCGVKPMEPALVLAKRIVAKNLKMDGLMGYEGHLQRLDLIAEKERLRRKAMYQLTATKKLLGDEGIPVNIVSAGGTGTYAIAGISEGITEVQSGNYLLMDTSYARYAPDFEPALSLLTTVISTTPEERFVVNAGIKEISGERGMPSVKNMPGTSLRCLHAEHGIVDIENKTINVEVGKNVELSVYYSDGTVNLHRKMYGVRNGMVEEIFEISI